MKTTKQYGIIGYPLSHSFSPQYFTDKFNREGISDCFYKTFELKSIDELPSLLAQENDLMGINVTIPYKEHIIPFLDQLSPEAAAIGAVNTVLVQRSSKRIRLIGDNTDWIGFQQSLLPLIQDKRPRALVLGTGGSSKAVQFVLHRLGISYRMVSRQKGSDVMTYDELANEGLTFYPLIINTTPLGMYPKIEELPALPYNQLTRRHILYDLIYNPAETRFLKHGAEAGALIQNGLDMLIRQAEAAWQIWQAMK